MRKAKITKLCTVHRDSTVIIRDGNGNPSVRVRFLAGHEYNLPEWWFTPLRDQGALTPRGGEAPPAWEHPQQPFASDGEPEE